MKKLFKSTLAVAGAFAMAFTTVAAVPTVAKADFNSAYAVFDPSIMKDGEVHYTIAGGMTGWSTLGEACEMQKTDIDGVYSFKMNLGAYDNAAEWNNRFKICQVDNTVLGTDAWDHSILLGTGLYGNSETQFRIENAEAGEFTVYFKPASGAVVIKDANGTTVDYTISWAGNEKDAPIIKANDGAFVKVSAAKDTKLEDWEIDKIPAGVTAVPDFEKINKDLDEEITNIDPSTMKAGEVEYTIAGGMTGWATLGRACTMKKTDIDGVYSMELELGAYDKAAEWNNRFKICQVDNTVLGTDAWDHSILLGTGLYGNSETQFRIENAEAGKFTVYFKPATGAVVIKDAAGANVDYTISWAGNEKDAPIIKANDGEFVKVSAAKDTKLEDWETDKLPTGVTAVPDFAKINAALATELTTIDPSTMKAGEVVYTVAGGMTDWATLGRANVMSATRYKGVYAMKLTLGAYDKAAEWNNRFKICKVDNTVLGTDAWDHSILLGTTLYGNSETQFRIENAEAGEFVVFYDANTGAVVVKDAAGADVDYTISWAGNEKDAPIIKANDGEFVKVSAAKDTKLEDWETDKLPAGVTAVPDFTTINAELSAKLAVVPAVEEEKPEVKATLSLKVSTKTIYTGKASNAATIKATVTGESNKVTWKSSNTKVATVKNGKVTAKKAGKAKIIATANGITKTVTITVKNPVITVKDGKKKVTSISIKGKEAKKLVVTTSPSKAGVKVTYANTASKKVVKLSTSGSKLTVKALKKGTAKIKITSGGATKTVTVKVK